MSQLIALLTDFGTHDIYVGVMKGVMKRISPNAEFIDITHDITPQSVQEGSLALKNSYHYFPEETVFLVVVDPGVGSTRRPVIVEADGYRFIAPDNGVLTYTLSELDNIQAHELSNSEYQLANISNTFHGRDIFAPAAAYATLESVALTSFGDAIDDLIELPQPYLKIGGNQIEGEVVHIDNFGNIITSIAPLQWADDQILLLNNQQSLVAKDVTIAIKNTILESIKSAYHAVEIGELLVQIDSNGALEVAINQGNAAKKLGIALGNKVVLEL